MGDEQSSSSENRAQVQETGQDEAPAVNPELTPESFPDLDNPEVIKAMDELYDNALKSGAIDEKLWQAAFTQKLMWNNGYIELMVISPTFQSLRPKVIHMPKLIEGTQEYEYVYPIHDEGFRLAASKASEMCSSGMSNTKLFYTIEKMIGILVEKIKAQGLNQDSEVQVSLEGIVQAQRKAFESIINLNYNVVVTNFDPGAWGENYLETMKKVAAKGYGYPTESPRNNYKTPHGTPSKIKSKM